MSDGTQLMLKEALEHLAADANAQAAYLRRIGTWPRLDELALALDDVAEASESWAPPLLIERVRVLSRKLDQMNGQENARHWWDDALHEPEWADVRRLAAEALATFG